MKKLTILLALLVPMIAFGQDIVKPQFPGGEQELSSFVKANFKIEETYLTLAKNKYTMMTCKIDVEGKMYGIEVEYTQIMNTAKNDINTELKRVLMLAAEKYTWVPAETDGKKVEAEQIITFVFDKDGAINTRIGTAINDGVGVAKEDPYTLQNRLKREEMSKLDSIRRANKVEEKEQEGVELKPIEDPEPYDEEVEWVEMEPVEDDEEIMVFDEPVVEEKTMIEVEEEVEEEPEMQTLEDDTEEDELMFDVVAVPPPPPPPAPEATDEPEVFYIVEKMPEFPGGQEALAKFIRDNIKMPTKAIENGAAGRVYLEFVVDESGKVKDIRILKDGVGYGCAEEALRVMTLMASKYTWIPGEQRNKKVAVRMRYPMEFNAD